MVVKCALRVLLQISQILESVDWDFGQNTFGGCLGEAFIGQSENKNCDFVIKLAPLFECVSGNHRSMYLEQSGRFIFGTFSGAVSCPNFVCSLVWVQKMKTNNS